MIQAPACPQYWSNLATCSEEGGAGKTIKSSCPGLLQERTPTCEQHLFNMSRNDILELVLGHHSLHVIFDSLLSCSEI